MARCHMLRVRGSSAESRGGERTDGFKFPVALAERLSLWHWQSAFPRGRGVLVDQKRVTKRLRRTALDDDY